MCEASDPNKPLTEYTHTVWTHKDGVPSAFIYAIVQTQDGYLWLVHPLWNSRVQLSWVPVL